jgi:hypothetical protein
MSTATAQPTITVPTKDGRSGHVCASKWCSQRAVFSNVACTNGTSFRWLPAWQTTSSFLPSLSVILIW